MPRQKLWPARGVKPLERALENAIESGNEQMVATIQDKIANFKFTPVVPKSVTDIDVAGPTLILWSLPGLSPISLAAIFMEPVFDWLYYPIDWNTNNFGNQFAPGLYSCDDLGLIIAALLYCAQPHPGRQLDLFDRRQSECGQGKWRANRQGEDILFMSSPHFVRPFLQPARCLR